MTVLKQVKNLDWFRDDGINLPMINDHVRNIFYDQIFNQNLVGKTCVEVGFGTGFLSMLAIKHGAHHIYAYEQNTDRYKLGKEIITLLDLSDKITLFHKPWSEDCSKEHPDAEILFTETFDVYLWGEHFLNTIKSCQQNHLKIIPSELGIDLFFCPMPKNFTIGCDKNIIKTSNTQYWFNPGVDVDNRFVSLLNNYFAKYNDGEFTTPSTSEEPKIQWLNTLNSTDWDNVPWKNVINAFGTIISGYSIDVNNLTLQQNNTQELFNLDFNQFGINFTTEFDKKTTGVCWPRSWIKHDTTKLYLDLGNWGLCTPLRIIDCTQQILWHHNWKTGKIEAELS